MIRSLFIFLFCLASINGYAQCYVLKADKFKRYIDYFNAIDHELYVQYYSNKEAWTFIKENIPFFECPDKTLEETYYFRWWTYRKHLKKTPDGFVITEFLPKVGWAGKYNTISCALGHHFYEGRWLHDTKYLDSYMRFWMDHSDNGLRNYSSWIADAWRAFLAVHPNETAKGNLLKGLVKNYHAWERTHTDSLHALFWQTDGADGMEVSAGGQISNHGQTAHNYKGIRPTLNSYMYGDARAISLLARHNGNHKLAMTFRRKADTIKAQVQRLLWSDSLNFFGSIALNQNTENPEILPVRELIGFIPWYFNLPDDNDKYAAAWKQLLDTDGFSAPFGPTTCEQRSDYFKVSYKGHECQWNGPSWPYATSQTLTAMANLLNNYSQQRAVTVKDYYLLLNKYAASQRRLLKSGKAIPWIDENLNPYTGDWIARTRLKNWVGGPWPQNKGGMERGKDYNHSTFCDLIISGLIGLRPQFGDTLTVNPLIPIDAWNYFCLDNIRYHGKTITILYDKNGQKYHKGKGFFIFVNGEPVYHSGSIQKVTFRLP